MISSLFPIIYGLAVFLLLWQAFKIMGRGFLAARSTSKSPTHNSKHSVAGDRTGRLTVHPELLDHDGRITEEELLTVRFSEDFDPPQSAETSAE
tara:strand:- start:868 stop:1149 length:282 start_codon:yes stop_codon:yes gene_type:complete